MSLYKRTSVDDVSGRKKHVWSAAGCLYDIYHVKANTRKVSEAAIGSSIFVPRRALSLVTAANKKGREIENREEGSVVKERDFFSGSNLRNVFGALAIIPVSLNANLRRESK